MAKPQERVEELAQKVERLLRTVVVPDGLVAGTVYVARTRCGRQTCKCMKSPYRHLNRCVSFREEGKSRTRTVPDALADDIQARAAAYRQARALRHDIVRDADLLLREIDEAIAAAVDRGQRSMLMAIAETRRAGK